MRVKVIGRIGDPEFKEVKDGLLKFTVFVNVVAWGDEAKELHGKLQKGDTVALNGEAESREWDGKTYWNTKVKAADVSVQRPEPEKEDDDDSSLPF